MTPREFFPSMPDEVFDMWLAPFIEEIGWPFTSPESDISGTRWQFLLGNIDLESWFSCKWRHAESEINALPLAFDSEQKIAAIILHCTKGANTMTANLQWTKERFRACAEYIMANRCIPSPVVAIPRHGRLEIVDGHHRLAAAFYLIEVVNGYKIPIYIASK